jgi:hypothetical protein
MRKNILKFSVGILAVLTLLVAGCAHSGRVSNSMALAGTGGEAGPQQGKARIVLMRPKDGAPDIQSSVFEIRDNQPVLLGILAAGTKVAYNADPGEHLFMVIGESADFMSANVLAGKTYYAQVLPRMGMWKPRYSLRPVSREKLDTKEFGQSLHDCRWVEKTEGGDEWAAHNRPSIVNKQTAYYREWTAKPEGERPNLRPEDGQ